jgi:hypothetical protein
MRRGRTIAPPSGPGNNGVRAVFNRAGALADLSPTVRLRIRPSSSCRTPCDRGCGSGRPTVPDCPRRMRSWGAERKLGGPTRGGRLAGIHRYLLESGRDAAPRRPRGSLTSARMGPGGRRCRRPRTRGGRAVPRRGPGGVPPPAPVPAATQGRRLCRVPQRIRRRGHRRVGRGPRPRSGGQSAAAGQGGALALLYRRRHQRLVRRDFGVPRRQPGLARHRRPRPQRGGRAGGRGGGLRPYDHHRLVCSAQPQERPRQGRVPRPRAGRKRRRGQRARGRRRAFP